jgi:hypothetical protein
MTIIATDGVIMVADGRKTWGSDVVADDIDKLRRRGSRVYGFAGSAPLLEPIIAWAETGADPAAVPKIEGAEWSLLWISSADSDLGRKVYRLTSACPYVEVFKPPMAAGAAIDLAIGAMLAGATPYDAVRIVCARTLGCGGVVRWMAAQEADDAAEAA